jgi:hypothetical protein
MRTISYQVNLNGQIKCWADDKAISFKLPLNWALPDIQHDELKARVVDFVSISQTHIGGLLFPLETEFNFIYV